MIGAQHSTLAIEGFEKQRFSLRVATEPSVVNIGPVSDLPDGSGRNFEDITRAQEPRQEMSKRSGRRENFLGSAEDSAVASTGGPDFRRTLGFAGLARPLR
jgi:hypothetical protein